MNKYKFSEISVGMEKEFLQTIDEVQMQKFLQISNDTNPLHSDKDYAVSKGFDGKVAYGLLSSAFYSTLVGVYLPGKYAIMHGINISFVKPVYISDRLSVYGRVNYINDAFRQIEIKAKITNQHNDKVSTALIKVGLIDE